jgi:hypothetical protein
MSYLPFEGITAVRAAPEWNAAPPVSYLGIIEFILILVEDWKVLVDVRTVITKDRIRRLLEMGPQRNLI